MLWQSSRPATDVSFRFPPQSDAIGDGSRFQEVGTGPLYRLEIPNCRLEDTGAYSILARNEHGECRAVISLQVYAKGESCVVDEAACVRRDLVALGTTALLMAFWNIQC